jgi:hypothetical protein
MEVGEGEGCWGESVTMNMGQFTLCTPQSNSGSTHNQQIHKRGENKYDRMRTSVKRLEA